jgi:hypothetical protein
MAAAQALLAKRLSPAISVYQECMATIFTETGL